MAFAATNRFPSRSSSCSARTSAQPELDAEWMHSLFAYGVQTLQRCGCYGTAVGSVAVSDLLGHREVDTLCLRSGNASATPYDGAARSVEIAWPPRSQGKRGGSG